jgi:mannose-1-phosphate guanylyltransferase
MLHAVIMAGGSGTRFWPKSRRSRPKQLLRLFGDSSMLQQTVERIAPLVPMERILIVTGADQADATRAQLTELPAANLVAEPCPRDTAACVGLAAAIVEKRDAEATLVVLPADHVIQPGSLFRKTIQAAASLVEEDHSVFVTLGVKPTRPETGYGYIERGEALGSRDGIATHRVVQFREKPDLKTAEAFVAAGNFVWNAGVFVWRARAIREALERHRPELAARLARVSHALGTADERQCIAEEYPRMERVPIDKAVMEKAENVKVLEVGYEWSDVGDWRSLAELIEHDSGGNAVQGPGRLMGCRDCVVIADEGKLIAVMGAADLVVVQSGGATLVAARAALESMKTLIKELEESGFDTYL